MREFAIYVPIWGYLVLLFLVRMGMACLLGLIISVISRRSGDVITAMGVSCFVVIILVSLGTILPAAWWLSPINLLGGTYLR
jgi:asparagine N-glycosylation enzyme membrane subunit Stt3